MWFRAVTRNVKTENLCWVYTARFSENGIINNKSGNMTCRATDFFECLSSFSYRLSCYWISWNNLNRDRLSSLPDYECCDITACGFVIVTVTIVPLMERVNLFFWVIFQPFVRLNSVMVN